MAFFYQSHSFTSLCISLPFALLVRYTYRRCGKFSYRGGVVVVVAAAVGYCYLCRAFFSSMRITTTLHAIVCITHSPPYDDSIFAIFIMMARSLQFARCALNNNYDVDSIHLIDTIFFFSSQLNLIFGVCVCVSFCVNFVSLLSSEMLCTAFFSLLFSINLL